MDRSLEELGYAILSGVVELGECESLAAILGPTNVPGRRGLLDEPKIDEWARSPRVTELLSQYFDGEPFPVRAIYFNKSPQANWSVGWHQELTIAVQQRCDVPGFGPWSEKDNVPHVQPPADVLDRMLAVRLNLDDTDETNGALRLSPGSHRFGRLSAEKIELRRTRPEVICSVKAGCVLLMRPLLLHASSRATTPSQRRVLHVEYAAHKLPDGLEWHEGT